MKPFDKSVTDFHIPGLQDMKDSWICEQEKHTKVREFSNNL